MNSLKFEVSPTELKKGLDWYIEHKENCPKYKNAMEANKMVASPVQPYSYMFTESSVGTITNIVCTCGENHDISDYDCW